MIVADALRSIVNRTSCSCPPGARRQADLSEYPPESQSRLRAFMAMGDSMRPGGGSFPFLRDDVQEFIQTGEYEPCPHCTAKKALAEIGGAVKPLIPLPPGDEI